ncbi:MAG: OmpA family protein [Gammaproteobacteria bacterium]|nr:OmpA family protein [Gammaproteobacteria bacterium]
MNNTPLVIVLVLVAAAAAGGWYKYFDQRGASSEESNRAGQLASDYDAAQRELQAATAQVKEAGARRQETVAQLQSAKSQLQKAEAQLQDNDAQLRNANTQVADARGRLQAARADNDKVLAQVGELQQTIRDLEENNATLRQARDELEAGARKAEQVWDSERDAWDAERAAWDAERDQSRRNRDGLQADLDAQRRTADARVKQLTHELAAAQGAERTTRGELERLRAMVAKLGEHEQMVDQLSTQLRNKNNDLTQMEARMEELESDAAEESERFARLHQSLQSELENRDVQLEQLENKLTLIRVGSDILFETGSAELSSDGEKTLALVARILNEYPDRKVNVEGHTDTVPIGSRLAQSYPSNWELSAARAARAVRYLENAGVEAWRLNVVGYGEQQPVAANDTAEARAKNRRIEIAVLPKDGYRVVEQK